MSEPLRASGLIIATNGNKHREPTLSNDKTSILSGIRTDLFPKSQRQAVAFRMLVVRLIYVAENQPGS